MRIWPMPPLLLTLALLIGVSLSFSNELNAQTTASGALAGVVTDQSMAAIAGAEVEVKGEARGVIQSTRTDRQGKYRFFFLAPGAYTLIVRHAGFREIRRTVNVLLGPAVSVNVVKFREAGSYNSAKSGSQGGSSAASARCPFHPAVIST